jgi:hypothetical protein
MKLHANLSDAEKSAYAYFLFSNLLNLEMETTRYFRDNPNLLGANELSALSALHTLVRRGYYRALSLKGLNGLVDKTIRRNLEWREPIDGSSSYSPLEKNKIVGDWMDKLLADIKNGQVIPKDPGQEAGLKKLEMLKDKYSRQILK